MPGKRAGLLLLLTSSTLALAAEDALPSMGLLEFLGEWEDDDGTWIDSQMEGATDAGDSRPEGRDND